MADTEPTEHTERMIVRELRQQLGANRTLLMHHEELLGALKVPMSEMQDYRLLERALRDTPIGDWMLVADQGDAEVRARAQKRAVQVLVEQGTQAQDAEHVVSLLTEALDWDKLRTAAGATPSAAGPVSPAAKPVSLEKPEPASPWNCVCGQTGNRGAFCIKCGRPRPQGAAQHPAPVPPTAAPAAKPVSLEKSETASPWNCVCGQTGNRGAFCIKCGRPHPQGAGQHPASVPPASRASNPVPPTAAPAAKPVSLEKPEPASPWNCVCGQTGNRGAFCIKCGRPRPQGAGQHPAPVPPASRASHPVPPTAAPAAKPVSLEKPEPASPWNCVCGQTGNKGAFCIKCGRLRPQGAVQNPASVPPASRASHPVPPVSPAAGAGSGQPWPAQGRPAPQPQPQPYAGAQPAAGKGKNLRIVALVAAIVVLAGTLVFFGMRALGGREDSSVASQTTSENGNELKEVKPDKKDKSQPAAQQRAMKTELSLGGLDLGDPINVINEVEKGKKPNDTRKDGKLVRYYFDNMQIVTQGNEVAALVSNDNKVTTKRGIHQGSTFAEVKNAYGSTYYKTGLGGSLTAIEYEAKTANGRRGLLRFAINDNTHKVDYISVRLMQ
jgi:hypothetical protein